MCNCELCSVTPAGVNICDDGYAIRLSRSYEDISGWVDWLRVAMKDEGQFAVYQHDADDEVTRTHCHLLVYGTKLMKTTMKKAVERLCGAFEKTDWSFKTTYNAPDGVKPVDKHFITYMSKGSLEPAAIHRITVGEINVFRSRWTSPTTLKIEDGKMYIKPSKEEKTLTKWEMLERMRAEYNEKMTDKEVINVIKKVLVRNKQVVGMYKVLDYYDAIMLYSAPDKFNETIGAVLARRQKL